ncbi:peptidoglycan-binding protein LysM, partial [Candidatus Dojkabacteria bacterium]|nr:peptidoglycan-binding protein LysM [Candidatus Dojkabacteria bacterium]
KKNKQYLKNYSDYVGKTINDIEITWSGLLAAAHLGGQKHVKDFLKSNGKKDFADANGVEISVYLKEFSGYKLIGI